ncbi:MAG TPA: GNAT family N-acetyltransferase, partial [Acetobacteraceae bacterium]|nr:GNAT family N-acetyltransferase [Acetobacteraceae bacterium]
MRLGPEAWALWRGDRRATPFQSPAWLNAWAEHLGGEDMFVAEVPGRALLPLFLWDDQGRRKLVPVGAGHSDYCDMIGETDAVPELLEAVARAPIAWDELVLPDLRPDSPLLGAPPPGWTVRDEQHEICPVLALPAGKALPDMLGKSQRRKLVHDRYRAEALGGVTVGLASPEEAPEALEALFALHAARWSAEEASSLVADPRVQAFYRAAVPALAEAGLLRMAMVRHADHIVTVLLGFRDAERFHAYLLGADVTVPKQSFGTLAFACLIEAAIAEGAREFHFLRGDEEFKYRWGAKPVTTLQR